MECSMKIQNSKNHKRKIAAQMTMKMIFLKTIKQLQLQ